MINPFFKVGRIIRVYACFISRFHNDSWMQSILHIWTFLVFWLNFVFIPTFETFVQIIHIWRVKQLLFFFISHLSILKKWICYNRKLLMNNRWISPNVHSIDSLSMLLKSLQKYLIRINTFKKFFLLFLYLIETRIVLIQVISMKWSVNYVWFYLVFLHENLFVQGQMFWGYNFFNQLLEFLLLL